MLQLKATIGSYWVGTSLVLAGLVVLVAGVIWLAAHRDDDTYWSDDE